MTDAQVRMIKALSDGLPLTEEPFDDVARRAGVSLDELLGQLSEWKSDRTIRRFGAMLRHRRAGYEANAMVVWNVPIDRIESFAEIAVSFANVSHCYCRPPFDGFDYNLYTMVHGKSKDECANTAKSIAEKSGVREYALLYTTREFKKTNPVYFGSYEF